MLVCERHLVLSLFWQLCSRWSAFQRPFAFRFVSFKWVHSLVSMQTVFTEMAYSQKAGLIQEAVSLFTQLSVVRVLTLLY